MKLKRQKLMTCLRLYKWMKFDDIDEIHHVNENKDTGMELTKSLKMIKYIILKVLYTNEK
jgi:hypothetical protein